MEHNFPRREGRARVNIQTYLANQGGRLNDEERLAELAHLREQDEKRLQTLLGNVLGSGAIFALCKLFPPMAPLLSLSGMFATGTAGNVRGLSDFAATNGGKLALEGGNLVVADVLNSLRDFNAIRAALSATENAEFIKWFGAGGTFTMTGDIAGRAPRGIGFEGVYHPMVIFNMTQWQANGLGEGSWLHNINEDLSQDLQNRISELNDYPYAQQLIRGGFSVVDGNGAMGIEEFMKGITRIEDVLGVDLYGLWRADIPPLREMGR